VRTDSLEKDIGAIHQTESLGCTECHATPIEDRPQAIRLDTTAGSMRISTPITNSTDCHACHDANTTHLGMVILDVSLIEVEEHLLQDLHLNIAVALITTLLISAAVYLLVHFVIVRRVEALQSPLAAFAAGDFSTRYHPDQIGGDEIGQLARTFNWMAEEIEKQAHDRKTRRELKQRAIREERERISRELHDGLAQLLGYVNAKAMAIRLMLKKDQTANAESHLLQLEDASRRTFVDVREAILGLRMNGQHELGFGASIEEYSKQFSKLSDLPVEVRIDETLVGTQFDTEVELQLMRIVQEALTNIRKHASAKHAKISLAPRGDGLLLEVQDDGIGFDHGNEPGENLQHFGLSMMQERAEAIGAELAIETELGSGTRIEIHMRENKV
jgi:signal transduction histidine kinase